MLLEDLELHNAPGDSDKRLRGEPAGLAAEVRQFKLSLNGVRAYRG